MNDVVESFGKYIGELTENNPVKARKRLLEAYRLFDFYQKHFYSKENPKSNRMLSNSCMKVMIEALDKRDKTALVSLFTPCELLYAFSLQPLCAEMFSSFLNGAKAEKYFVDKAEENGISETYCSYHKVLIGAELSELLPRFSCVINTSLACDANNLTFRLVSHEQGLPQFYIDVPYEDDEDAIEYVRNELMELTNKLEKYTGQKLDINKLKEITKRSQKTLQLMRETLPYRKDRWLTSDLTSEMYEALLMHIGLGSFDALKYAEQKLLDYQNAPQNTGLKILWMHSNPFSQDAVKNVLNNNILQHVAATELSYEIWNIDKEDDPYTFMAKRLVYSSYNGPVQRRIQKNLEMAKILDVDGVICFCEWGCKQGNGCVNLIAKKFMQEGYPFLILNGDGVDRANATDGQVSTRLEAFFEMIRGGKS